jgi:hypothetical protein
VKGQPQDWGKLIRKLRWIGMEDEARRLQMAVSGPKRNCIGKAVQYRLGSQK